MRRILIDLRIFLAAAIVLGLALAGVSIAFLGVYNEPIDHVVQFQHDVTATVVNYSTIVGEQNFTEIGVPVGALLEFGWQVTSGPIAVTILVVNGTTSGVNRCLDGPASMGSCGWTTDNRSFTVSIFQSMMTRGLPGLSSANYTATVSLQGWYSYSTPAR